MTSLEKEKEAKNHDENFSIDLRSDVECFCFEDPSIININVREEHLTNTWHLLIAICCWTHRNDSQGCWRYLQ